MSKIINIQEIPKEEIVYARKDFTGWRIVQPIIDPITKKFIWKNFLSKKGFLTLGFILLLLGVLYLAFREQLANYQNVLSDPCKYCMELTSSHSNTLNLSLP